MNAYLQSVLDRVKARYAGEPEFVQTVEEVFESLEFVIDAHPEYEKCDLLGRIVEPERMFTFRVVWTDDQGVAHKFKYPKRVRASHILIASNPAQIQIKLRSEKKAITPEELEKKTDEIMNENLKKAEDILKKVKKAPTTFAKVAKEHSQDTASAIRGGDLGFFAKEEMVEPFANKAFEMAPNTISDIVQTPYGYHIIMVTDRNEAGVLSFEQSKKDIINYLESQDKVDILKNKVEALRKEAKIEYYDENYTPEVIQKKIKEAAKENPQLKQDFSEQAPQQ